jgi:predicted dinucleotide-binding enzyme
MRIRIGSAGTTGSTLVKVWVAARHGVRLASRHDVEALDVMTGS